MVYFVIMRIGYNADFGVDLKFRIIMRLQCINSSDFLHNQIRISESDIRYPNPAGSWIYYLVDIRYPESSKFMIRHSPMLNIEFRGQICKLCLNCTKITGGWACAPLKTLLEGVLQTPSCDGLGSRSNCAKIMTSWDCASDHNDIKYIK